MKNKYQCESKILSVDLAQPDSVDVIMNAFKDMLANKNGKIINVASTAAFGPGPYMAVYYATKAYVLSFSQAIREEYKDDDITVSTLFPGPTKTAFEQRAGLTDTYLFSGFFPVMTAEKVAEIAYRGLINKRRVIVPGVMNKSLVCLMPHVHLVGD